MEKGQMWRQYFIGAAANLAIVSVGYAMVWTSPIAGRLTSNDTSQSPFDRPVSSDESAWMGSLLNIGAIFGPFIAGFTASKIGRKWGLLLSAIPLLIGWILVACAQNMSYLYAGRIFWGVAVGISYTISPMYCAEISTVDSRGALGSFLQIFVTVGFMIVYGFGPLMDYGGVAYLGIAVAVIFVACFFFMPESPTYHLIKENKEAAAECLMTLRGKSREGVEDELSLMAADVAASMEKTASIGDVFRGSNFKAFYISTALVILQQLCGVNAVLFYMTSIFNASGTSLKADYATMIIGAVQIIASCMTPFVVDRYGRRILLLISSCGTTIGLIIIGVYFLLKKQNDPAVPSIGILPVIGLVVFIITYCWGLGPLPWAVMGELFPIEVKSAAAPIATSICWILSFLVTKLFPMLEDDMYIGFFVFAGCCILAFLFTLFIIPETKGKSTQEIQELLGAPKAEKL